MGRVFDMLKCEIRDDQIYTFIGKRYRALRLEHKCPIERGVCCHDRIYVGSDYLTNSAPEISKLSTITDNVIPVSGTTARTEIEEHEAGIYQSADTFIELDRGINPRKATRFDFRKKVDTWIFIFHG